MKRSSWRITALVIGLAALATAFVQLMTVGGDFIRAYRDLEALVCRPICNLADVQVEERWISFPGGIAGSIDIHKRKGYEIYFLGRLDEDVETNMRRAGFKDRYENYFVDEACGSGHETKHLTFDTPPVHETKTLWIDYYAYGDGNARPQEPASLKVVVPEEGSPTSVELELENPSLATMTVSWSCRAGVDGVCWRLPALLLLVLVLLAVAAYKGWSPD